MKKLVVIFISCLNIITYTQNMIILDTANNDPYIYRSLNILSSDFGFNPLHKHFYEIKPEDIDNADPIILAIDGTFFAATARELSQKHKIKSPILQYIYTIIDQISNQKNKTIMIVLPNAGKSVALLTLAHQLLRRLGIQEKRQMSHEFESFLKTALLSVLQSDASKSLRYDTSLLYTKKTAQNQTDGLKKIPHIQDKKTDEILATPLPLNKTIFQESFELQPVYPMGFYVKNRISENQFLVVSASALRFADIQDLFAYNPVDPALRKKLLAGLQNLMAEFFQAAQTHKIKPSVKQELPKQLMPPTKPSQKPIIHAQRKQLVDKRYGWAQKGIACGWLALGAYQGKEDEAAENLLKSGLTMLWLQLNPEWYLSENAVNKKGNDEFLQQIQRFTQALKNKSKELQLPIPKFFVGMEMTGNLATHLPKKPAVDVYGTTYSKIPNPLDFDAFWKPEVIDVLQRFKKAWDQGSGSSLPLSGVFLDFEMYHAPEQTGQFTSLMDFSDPAWHNYIQKTNKQDLTHLHKINNRVSYLMNHGLLKEYFSFLQEEAYTLGRMLKQNIARILPEGIIAAYNITLPHSWFYKGIMGGLSSPSEPLILATFNNEFYPHYEWLKNNQIYLYHLPVLLLSKLQSKEDFKKIGNLWTAHDGIWFNRVSRLEEPRSADGKKWDYGLESTPLDTQTVISLMQQWISKFQK